MGFSWRGKYWVQENEGGVTRCGRLTVSTGVEHGTDNGGSIGDSAVNTGLPRAVQRTLDQGTCLRLGPAQCRFERNIALRQLYGNKGHDEHEVVHGQCDTGTLLWCMLVLGVRQIKYSHAPLCRPGSARRQERPTRDSRVSFARNSSTTCTASQPSGVLVDCTPAAVRSSGLLGGGPGNSRTSKRRLNVHSKVWCC